jgi:hypothetical protein
VKKNNDPIVAYQKIRDCEGCGWHHDGDLSLGGEEIRKDRNGQTYFICTMTKKKLHVTVT